MKGDHVHQLENGEFTGASDRDGNHMHQMPDGSMSFMDQEGPDHTHLDTMGPPVPTVAKSDSSPLFQLPGVPIFQIGTWNGDLYTEKDLDDMVSAFEENRATMRPFLKLGHNKEQKLLSKDGMPAAGWIDSLRRVGNQLIADFVDIPKKIYDLLVKKAYRNVSAEIYWDIKINEKKYPRLLSAVSLLGADMPALNSLDDVLSLYGLENSDSIKKYTEVDANKIRAYNFNKEFEMPDKSPNELKLEKELAEIRGKLEDSEKSYAATEAKLKEREESSEKLQNRIATLEAERREESVKNYCLELEKEELLTPAMQPLVEQLVSGKKEFSLGEGEGAKNYDTRSALREIIKISKEAAKVKYTENTQTGKKVEPDADDKLIAAANKYAADHGVEFGDAVRIVRKELEDE